MGNGVGKFGACFSGDVEGRRSPYISVLLSNPLDEGLGHSFCYVRPDPSPLSSSKVHSEETTTFSAISGASVSANASTPLSTSLLDLYSTHAIDRAAAFESSDSFASIPLQPIPRSSGPIYGNSFYGGIHSSGPLERGFLSGPIERGFMSGPLDRGIFSGPLEKGSSIEFQRSFSHAGFASRSRSKTRRLIRILRRALSKTVTRGRNSIVAPIKATKEPDWILGPEKYNENLTVRSVNLSCDGSLEDDNSKGSQNLQWAQGKAGEDRVHVVVSEEHGWVFVGIYDGFNGPDAPDYLLSNLYSAVHQELKGLLWDEKSETSGVAVPIISPPQPENSHSEMADSKPGSSDDFVRNQAAEACSSCFEPENSPCPSGAGQFDSNPRRRKGKPSHGKYRGSVNKREDIQRRWKCEFDREREELDRRLNEQLYLSHFDNSSSVNHADVLKALSRALRKTEEAFLDIADKMLVENPELALMGSCLLVMLMKGDDVYVMNVGDSRAVLAQNKPDRWLGKISNELEKINEETMHDLDGVDSDQTYTGSNLSAMQLSTDHSTSEEEEVWRIKNDHPDDACAVMNDRVKGSLKVTRAFGAGFLKQPKWNDALLEMFRVDFVGTSPYITCSPSLYHHRLGSKDRLIILSSDGLYQYFTNEEAVLEVELFIQLQPEGDPAQHLVEEVLFRAARKAGMDFHGLLEIPQGDRRKYHDDVSIIVISLEGRIWRSCV